MTTIQIEVFGSDLETIAITLNETEVKALYENNKALKEQMKGIEKELDSAKLNYKWSSERNTTLVNEINQANMLLTALDVQVKTNDENAYNQTELPVATRIALYIATNK